MNKIRQPGAIKNSRLPPSGIGHQSASKTGVKRGIAGLNARPKAEAPIRVPKKNYNLNNLGPDAYPDEDDMGPSKSFVTGGGDGL